MGRHFNYSAFAVTLILLLASVAVFAAPPANPPPGGNPPPGIPLDGGIFLLLASGLVYGAKKLYK
jgi:hypothetical protein